MSSDLMRLAGINSGYDTEAMIEKMMSAYQTKIDNQNKKLTKLTWKQEAYRDITSKLTTFKNKYFDILKKDSYLMSPNSFKNFKTTITNKNNADRSGGISVTTSSSSLEGSHSIKVTQTATATKLSGKTIGSQNFELDLNKAANYSDYTVENGERKYSFALDFKVGDVAKTVEFDINIAQGADGKINMDDFAAAVETAMNDKLEEAFGLTGKTSASSNVTGGLNADGNERFVSVEKDANGKLNFKVGGNAGVTVTEKTGDFGLTRLKDRVAIAAQSAVTGKNTVSVTVGNVTKNVSFNGVSATYFDSRNEPGNGAILNQYNALKLEAYKNANNGRTPTSEQLEEFAYTSDQAAKDMNSEALKKALNNAFSSEGATFTLFSDGYLNCTKEFAITSVAGGTLGLTKASASNKVATGSTLKDLGIAGKGETVKFKINGKEISVASSASINDLVKAVNGSGAGVTMNYSNLDGKLTVTANDMGNGGDVEIEANKFTAALGLAVDENTAMKAEIGRNAIFELDGVEIYHNNNSYTFDGTTINFEEAELGSEYTVGISKSYDDVKQTIKDFVKDYNQLLDDVYGYIGTAPKRDNKNNLYEPLTDEQREEMSEKEIENWEKAAKQGILYNDSTVSTIMSNIRMALYNSVDSSDGKKFGLYNMGITTMAYKDSSIGKLEIDEEAFDKAFEEHAEDIMKLFTDSDNGIMKKVNTIIDNAVRSTGKVKGTLVRKAGLETGTSAKDNEIYRQMEQINKRITTLQNRYDSKEEYWWKVFTNLEKMMSNMNSQSSYLANYFGYTGNYQ
ncbi:MAG: flagellar filament capping protein FliD [Oscillospiraceae bacterium]|nr:flagellar filament capping protein FliD [Oscillospiraceae bacterium]